MPNPVVSSGWFFLLSAPVFGADGSVPGFDAGGFVPVSVPGFTVVELLFSANPLSIFATKYLEISSAFTTSIAPLLPFILPTLLYPVL